MQRAADFPSWSQRRDFNTWLQVIMKPVRDDTAGLALYSDRQRIGPCWRRRNSIATVDGLAVDVKFQSDELTGLETEQMRFESAKQKTFDVVRLITHADALQSAVDIGVPFRRRRIPQMGTNPAVSHLVAHFASTTHCQRIDSCASAQLLEANATALTNP